MSKIIEKNVINKFKGRNSFTRGELFDFFLYSEPDLKKGTFGWRIYALKNKDIIKEVQRGVYTINHKAEFKPLISSKTAKIVREINKKYEGIEYCIWSTACLNEFSQHQSSKQIQIIEIEKEYVESLYFCLKDKFEFNIYLNPDDTIINYYLSEDDAPVIIKKFISRSPIIEKKENKLKIIRPSLEKILVDLYADEKLFYFYRGSELKKIYENALSNYTINFTKLFSYAARRGKKNDIKLYLIKNMGKILKGIIK